MAEISSTVERTLPHNLEAERSVLGAILIQNDTYNVAAEVVRPEDFYRDAHRRIFDKIIALSERGQAVDFVTLKEELGRAGELETVGGPAYIASLVDGVPRATNVEHYAKIVKEKAVLRNLIAAANTILLRRVRGRPGRRGHPRPRRALDLRDCRGTNPVGLRVALRPRGDGVRVDPEGARREEADHRASRPGSATSTA